MSQTRLYRNMYNRFGKSNYTVNYFPLIYFNQNNIQDNMDDYFAIQMYFINSDTSVFRLIYLNAISVLYNLKIINGTQFLKRNNSTN